MKFDELLAVARKEAEEVASRRWPVRDANYEAERRRLVVRKYLEFISPIVPAEVDPLPAGQRIRTPRRGRGPRAETVA